MKESLSNHIELISQFLEISAMLDEKLLDMVRREITYASVYVFMKDGSLTDERLVILNNAVDLIGCMITYADKAKAEFRKLHTYDDMVYSQHLIDGLRFDADGRQYQNEVDEIFERYCQKTKKEKG